MKKSILPLFISIFLLSGCVSMSIEGGSPASYQVKEQAFDSIDNPFTIYSVDVYKNIIFTISAERIESEKLNTFSITIVYEGNSWLFIEGNVVIQADDSIIRVQDSDPHRMVLTGANVRETITVLLTDEDFHKIANASQVRIQFHGSPKDIPEVGVSYLKQFYEQYN